MGKHLKTENSSPRNDKYNHKSGWLAGMLHVFDFHHWRTKNRAICWKTPRTHSLLRETEEHEPFLDSKEGDSKMISVVTDNNPIRQETKVKKMMTARQVTEYVDFLEILRKEDVFVKILKNPDSEFGKQIQIKSNPRVLPKSGSFPLSRSSRPARLEHKHKENWYAPKQNGAVLTLNVPRDTSQGHKAIVPSHGSTDDDHGFNHAVINGFREIKKLLKNALKDRNHTKKKKKFSKVAEDDYVGRYSQLLEHSFRREGGELRSRSLKLSYEEKKRDSRDAKPQFFRRISSLSSLEVLGSFLTDLPRDSSEPISNLETRKAVDHDTTIGLKKSLSLSESPVRAVEKEDKDEKSQENRLESPNQRILQQDANSVPITGSSNVTTQKTEPLLSQGLGLSSVEIINHEEDDDAYFCYVKKVLQISGFLENKDNGEKWYSEEQPLNPSLVYELEIQEEAVNKELLFDLVNEAVAETHNQSYIYFPKTFPIAETHNQSYIYFPKTFPNGKSFLDEVWGRVEWSLSGLGAENRDRSLDDIVGRDLTKSDGWMNLRGDSEWITLELEDLIFDEVLDELLCVY